KVVCDPECATGCVPNKPSQCCSKDCAAGCTGQFDRCEKCRFYNNSGTCVVKCPPHYDYNQHTMKYERTDNGKYAYLFECVEECPGRYSP
ncbi:hypothetical protein HELRODRAFT_90592, partial [Helobdella robusta]|uniref:Furin-like cysteine-rich domain-containing protein n=1 Tax=Helobdella robusta TaxID=6412 RepID=T1G7T2_HELRO